MKELTLDQAIERIQEAKREHIKLEIAFKASMSIIADSVDPSGVNDYSWDDKLKHLTHYMGILPEGATRDYVSQVIANQSPKSNLRNSTVC